MASVLRCESLAQEHVSKVRTATGALNLDPLSVTVGESPNRTVDLLVEARPAALGIELVVRSIKRRPAPLAHIGTGLELVLVFSRKRRLGPFVDNDPLFLSREFPQRRCSGRHNFREETAGLLDTTCPWGRLPLNTVSPSFTEGR